MNYIYMWRERESSTLWDGHNIIHVHNNVLWD